MKVGVPKELKDNEYRVAITPAGVRELVVNGQNIGSPGIEDVFTFSLPDDIAARVIDMTRDDVRWLNEDRGLTTVTGARDGHRITVVLENAVAMDAAN